jgi:predicted small secreted protein
MEEAKEIHELLKSIKKESQEKYNQYRTQDDPPYSKLNQDIMCVWTTKRKQKIGKIYEYLYENGLVDEKLHEIEKKIKNTKKTDRKEGKTRDYWITINPPETSTLENMLKDTERFVNRAIVEKYMYCVEQRSDNEEEIGRGKHIHLYFKIHEENYEPPSKIIKYLKSTFKKLLNVNTKALWIQPLKEEYVKDKIDYMLEKNKDGEHEEKERKSQMDKIYRETNNLDDYYTNIPYEEIYNQAEVVSAEALADETNEE